MIQKRALFLVSCFILTTSTNCSAGVAPLTPPTAPQVETQVAPLIVTEQAPAGATSTPGFVVDSSNPITRQETLTMTPTMPLTPTNDASAPNPQVLQAMEDLAVRTSSVLTDIEVVDFEYVVWPDKGFGCPQPGMVYPQVQQDGMLIHLRVAGVIYAYHSGEGRPPFLCEASAPAQPAPETRPPKER